MSEATAPRPTIAEEGRARLRGRVLDAVGELLGEDSWRDVTMAEVATRAGVSRQTLYNAFGGREELAQAYLLQEAELFLAAIETAVRTNVDDPRMALTAAAELFLSLVATHPMVRAVSSGQSDELVALATTRGGVLLTTMTDRLAALLEENWQHQLAHRDASLVSETLVRLAISHAALPSASPERTAADLSRLLGPFVDELLA